MTTINHNQNKLLTSPLALALVTPLLTLLMKLLLALVAAEVVIPEAVVALHLPVEEGAVEIELRLLRKISLNVLAHLLLLRRSLPLLRKPQNQLRPWRL